MGHGPLNDVDPVRTPVLYWFQLVRHPDSRSRAVHQIDDSDGGSTEITAKDIHGDHHPAVLVSNKRGTYLYLQDTPGKCRAKTHGGHTGSVLASG